MRTPQPRPGFTLLELLCVLALLLILAAVTLPSFDAIRGNSRQKAAADLVRTRIADARARAIETGVPYRLAISTDGTRLRLAPDGADFANLPASDQVIGAGKVTEDQLEKATAGVAPPDGSPVPAGDDNWVTVATFKPDGTCREDLVVFEVREEGYPPIRIQIRGLTGTDRVLPNQTDNTGNPGAMP
ncbi:MAG TPA: prepilin-type N-terminal cleavage/methylation domain-containing protein [Gemmataceae bacterium]|nr:prepilin-type N-terminal cleavage/methylation domain-containing protein [Gemmataceae bacterium]